MSRFFLLLAGLALVSANDPHGQSGVGRMSADVTGHSAPTMAKEEAVEVSHTGAIGAFPSMAREARKSSRPASMSLASTLELNVHESTQATSDGIVLGEDASLGDLAVDPFDAEALDSSAVHGKYRRGRNHRAHYFQSEVDTRQPVALALMFLLVIMIGHSGWAVSQLDKEAIKRQVIMANFSGYTRALQKDAKDASDSIKQDFAKATNFIGDSIGEAKDFQDARKLVSKHLPKEVPTDVQSAKDLVRRMAGQQAQTSDSTCDNTSTVGTVGEEAH